jgi:hypothetical protein
VKTAFASCDQSGAVGGHCVRRKESNFNAQRLTNALGGIPNKAQVGDMGIDGRIFPLSARPERTLKTVTRLGEISPKNEPFFGSLLRYGV